MWILGIRTRLCYPAHEEILVVFLILVSSQTASIILPHNDTFIIHLGLIPGVCRRAVELRGRKTSSICHKNEWPRPSPLALVRHSGGVALCRVPVLQPFPPHGLLLLVPGPCRGSIVCSVFFGAVVPMLQLTTAVSHSPTLKPNKQKYHRGFTPHGSDKNWSGHTAVMVVRTHKVCLISWPRVAQGWRVAVVIVVGSNGVAALPLPIRWCAQYLVTTMNPPGRHCDYSDQVCSWLDSITRGKVGGRLSKKVWLVFEKKNNIFS